MRNVASNEGGCGLAANSEPGKLWKLLRVVGAVVLAAVVVAVLFMLLNWYVAPTKPSGRKDLVLTLAQILGGTALLSGLYFTWRTLQVNREGQITERFTRAIEQLGATDENGNPKLEMRLGAIYALERIARDSERDHWSVMEVLIAYVRQNAPWPPKKNPEKDGSLAPPQASQGEQETPNSLHVDEPKISPTTDIEAILTVLWRRRRHLGHGEEYTLSLERVDLRGAAIANTHLEQAAFTESHLERAFLDGVYMQGAFLVDTHLEKADLEGANLQEANLVRTHLQGANLQNANIEKANIIEAHLEEGDLQGANLLGADIRGAYLRGANLQGANLQGANLLGADNRGAYLRGANLQGAKVTDEQLADMQSLQGATMPDGSEHS